MGDPEALYMQLGELVRTMPDLEAYGDLSSDTQIWLARAYMLVEAAGVGLSDEATFKVACEQLQLSAPREISAAKIRAIVYRALARAERQAPASAQGAFVVKGNVFEAMAAIGKVVKAAANDVLIVDPYMDDKALTDFAILVPEQIRIRLLADQQDVKASLRPAVARWTTQYGSTRPLEARLSPPRTLHDRAILIDGTQAWVLTQSLNAFATRSHGLISRVDPETAGMKIPAYEAVWNSASKMP
jgi:hypothetical protein